MMLSMNEKEKGEYLRRKLEDDESRRRIEEAERIKREEELARALDEAKRHAFEDAKRKAELERRLQFMRSIYNEANELGQTQSITHAFVFSYFELMNYLGLEIPKDILSRIQRMKR